jgi:hypothetical protein
MRAQEFLTELFEPGKDWKWSFQGSEEAVAVFHVGEIPYMFHAYGGDGDWEVEFKNARRDLDRSSKFGLTGTGNSAEVMSTVVDIMRAFLAKYQDRIDSLTFSAKEDSRQGLYARMVKRLLPDWDMRQYGGDFVLLAPEEVMAEDWGVEKYPIPLPIGQYLAVGSDEFAPPGNYSSADDLVDDVYDLIDAGVEPDVVAVDPKTLLATQDWLSNAGGDDPVFEEYPDRPVVYEKAGKFYILDGHHRTTRAWRSNRPISVYLFRDNQLREDVYSVLDSHQCGPFDGGCVLVAQALQKIHGGNIVVLVDKNDQAQHAAVAVNGQLMDYSGAAGPEQFVRKFEADEHVNIAGVRPIQSGDLPEALHNDPDTVTQLINVLGENFADGKNPGRKGLAKRMGVNTKASVSSLRKTAKNSSGEKQRMAHWLANMKSGRNKNK